MAPKLLLGFAFAGMLATIAWLGGQLSDQRDQLSRMEKRVANLETEIEEVWDAPAPTPPAPLPRLARAAAPAASPTVEGATEEDAPSAFRQRTPGTALDDEAAGGSVHVVREALLDVLSTEDPQVREGFRQLMREEQAVMRDELREQRKTRWEQRTGERLASFGSEHGLTQAQQDALFALLTAARDRSSELFRQAREGEEPPSRGQLREQMQALRREAENEAREVLDDKQFEAYQQMIQEERLLGPGGGRRGPPGERGAQ
ncbi:MAG: hypothetical protein OEZ06_10995 [Myxococcales bacterium]|nr:hypothetical protein [Myxococcales bacterium]